MPQTTKVLLIEDNPIEARLTQHWLGGLMYEVKWVETLAMGLDHMAKGGIDVVILDLNLPDSRGVDTFDSLYAAYSEVPIVVLTGEVDEAIGPATVAKGAQDYLVKKQANGPALMQILRFAIARNQAQLEKIKLSQSPKVGRVIGFLGAKGGVGTTTTALNIACALALNGKSVILAELHPFFGTLACQLHSQPTANLYGLLKLPLDRLASPTVNSFLCKGPSGLQILFGPGEEDVQEAFLEIDPQKIKVIIDYLRQLAEIVILDLPTQPSAATQVATSLCNFVVVLTEREPGSVHAGQVCVKRLRNLRPTGDSHWMGAIVVNRVIYSNNLISFADIQSQMGLDIVGIISSAASEHSRAMQQGIPLVEFVPEHPAAASFIEIAGRLAEQNVVAIHPG